MSAGADAEETEGPPGEHAQLDESDEKTIRTWLLYTEARRADARRLRKREKEGGHGQMEAGYTPGTDILTSCRNNSNVRANAWADDLTGRFQRALKRVLRIRPV